MRKLIIWPGISRRIGTCGLTHEGLLRFLNRLRLELEDDYQTFCDLRDEENPRFFRYLVTFADGGLMHAFDFVIDDSTSPDHLFIEDFATTRIPSDGAEAERGKSKSLIRVVGQRGYEWDAAVVRMDCKAAKIPPTLAMNSRSRCRVTVAPARCKLPRFSRRDHPVDRLHMATRVLIEQPRSHHLRHALTQSQLDIAALRFQHRYQRGRAGAGRVE